MLFFEFCGHYLISERALKVGRLLSAYVTITLDEDGGIADPGGQLAEFWETLKDTAVNMVFLAAAGATVAAIILLLLKAPAIAPEILPLLPTLMNLLRVKIA